MVSQSFKNEVFYLSNNIYLTYFTMLKILIGWSRVITVYNLVIFFHPR
jgi:hypothetical protein